MEYRKDIDGLRAIAIIFVLCFHLNLNIFNNLFSGGFIGVDIFFVVSGYLITGLLLKNFDESKSIKLFYLKRARRLLPAYYVVIFISIIFSYFYLVSSYFKEFSGSVISATALISNIFFAIKSNYFDAQYFLKPLLHTWSLSVEFQFIIFYPLFLYYCLKYFDEKKIIYLFFFLIILNLLFVQFGGNLQFAYPYLEQNIQFFNPPKVGTFFYSTSRIWEFLFGAIFYFLRKKKIGDIKIFYYLGFFIILFSLFFFSKQIENPSFNNLLPVIGTCLILLNGKKDNIVKKILSLKYLVFVGLISYSLYLVHFPIISFSHYIFAEEISINSYYVKIIIISLSFFLSVISWQYIEKPFRNKKKVSNKSFFKFTIVILSLILIGNFVIKNSKKDEEALIKNKYSYINFEKKNLFGSINGEFLNNNKLKILILGDSQSENLYHIFQFNRDLIKNFEFKFFDTFFEFHFLSDNTKLAKKYRQKLINSKEFIMSDYIFIATHYQKKDINSFDDNIDFLKKYNKKIVVSNLFPEFSLRSQAPLLTMLLENKNKKMSAVQMSQGLFDYISKDLIKYNQILDKKIKENNLILFDRTNLICNFETKSCPALTKKNQLVFLDSTHLTGDGANYFSNSNYLMKFFNKSIFN